MFLIGQSKNHHHANTHTLTHTEEGLLHGTHLKVCFLTTRLTVSFGDYQQDLIGLHLSSLFLLPGACGEECALHHRREEVLNRQSFKGLL